MKLSLFIAILALLVIASSVSAAVTCEYNGIKTVYDYNFQSADKKMEYANEKFVRLVDPKAITDLAQLKGLTCLESADFYNQRLTGDLENLKGLTNLKVLSLHTNPDIKGDVCSFAKAIKLKSLKMAFDQKVYGNVSCLKDLNLETFAVTFTNITGKLSDFSHMTNLKALYLSGTKVSGDVAGLRYLVNLEELGLSDPVMDGSRFFGDFAVLDNLTKLRRASLYNLNSANCKHFHETHPGIEGGCSAESKSGLIDPNVESEKIIGRQPGISDKSGPPKECMVNNEFIGEVKCRALMDKNGPRDTANQEMPGRNETLQPTGFRKIIMWFLSLFK